MVTAGAIVPAPGAVSCSTGMRRFHVAASWITSPDDPDLRAQGDPDTHALPPRIVVQPPGKRDSLAVYGNWRPRKKVPSQRGDTFGIFSFVDALAGRPRLWPALRPSSARRRTTSMAANTPSAGSGGSRGIAGGRDRVRKNLYAAAESRLGRGGSPPGMRAAQIGDNGLKRMSTGRRARIKN
jgi:hypothetical protein